MSRPVTATSGTTNQHDTERHGARRRSPAQWFCLIGGLALLLAGLLGFLADATFDTGLSRDTDQTGNADGQLQGDGFLGFEVNGWHNVVHIASGLLLLFGAWQWRLAKAVALIFGLTYGLVTIIGLIDGNDVLGIIPVNAADNILHLALSALGIIAGLLPGYDKDRGRDRDAQIRRETTIPPRRFDSAQDVGRTERPAPVNRDGVEVERSAEIGDHRAERDRSAVQGRHPDRL